MPWNATTSLGDKPVDQLDGFAFALQQGAADTAWEGKRKLGNSLLEPGTKTIRVSGHLPAEAWCRLGAQVLPKLGNGAAVRIAIDISANVDASGVERLQAELQDVIRHLGLSNTVRLQA